MLKTRNDRSVFCFTIECHISCDGGCRDGTAKGCEGCKDGWLDSEEDGCIGIRS